MAWTRDKEAQLQRLRDQRDDLEEERSFTLRQMVELLGKALDITVDLKQAESFVEHADDIRDALAPFDSGVRAAAFPPPMPAPAPLVSPPWQKTPAEPVPLDVPNTVPPWHPMRGPWTAS